MVEVKVGDELHPFSLPFGLFTTSDMSTESSTDMLERVWVLEPETSEFKFQIRYLPLM